MSDNPIKDWYRLWLWVIVILSASAILLVLAFGSGITDYKDRVSFLAVNIISIFAFDMVLISALTAREMKEIMDRQESEMTKQRIAADVQNKIAEQSLELARLAAQVTKDQLQLARLTQRPEIDLQITFDIDFVKRRIEMLCATPNVGKTTAYRFGIQICPAWRPKDYDGPLEYVIENERSSEPIRVGTPRFVHPSAIVFKDKALFDGFFTGHNWLIIYGIYWFYDGAGTRYEEVFCRRLNHLDPEHAVQCEASLRSKVIPLNVAESSPRSDEQNGENA